KRPGAAAAGGWPVCLKPRHTALKTAVWIFQRRVAGALFAARSTPGPGSGRAAFFARTTRATAQGVLPMNEQFMKERPILPLLTSMALPMVVSMLVNSLYNIVDSFFVARISEDAMTALSLVYPIQNFVNAAAIGFGVGMTALITFHLGAGGNGRASSAATHGLALSAVHGLVLMVGCIAALPAFLGLFTRDPAVLDLGVRYGTIVFLFSVVIMLGLAFE